MEVSEISTDEDAFLFEYNGGNTKIHLPNVQPKSCQLIVSCKRSLRIVEDANS